MGCDPEPLLDQRNEGAAPAMDLVHANARVRDLARRILAERPRHAEERVRMRDEDHGDGDPF